MKAIYFFVLTLLLATAMGMTLGCSSGGGGSSGDDDAIDDDATDDDATDDDAVDDDTADDDAADDDTVDDDTTDDDTVDDDTFGTTIVLDDGTSEGGVRTLCATCELVQGFTPSVYPALLTGVSFYIDRWDGITRTTKLIVIYSTTKGDPDGVATVYESTPFAFAAGAAWNFIDLTAVPELTAAAMSGDIFVGIAGTDDLDTGPFVGWDNEGPGNYWESDGGPWTEVTSGCMMVRPTVQYPID